MGDRTSRTNASPPLVALVEWIVPGGGYWMIGQRTRALVVGVSILVLFMLGILISGIRVVEAPELSGSGSVGTKILNRPWFIGQVFMGPTAIASAWISDELAHSARFRRIEAKARLAEIGTLYTAVAGMLNLLAMIDSAHRATQEGGSS
jgi:hypothetical protein